METKFIIAICLVCTPISRLQAQNADRYFHTIREKKNVVVTRSKSDLEVEIMTSESLDVQDGNVVDTTGIDTSAYTSLSVGQLEELIRKYEENFKNRSYSAALTHNNNFNILNYYNGESRPLTLSNLLDVMKETGLSNQLFVLAQAVLETGNFTSNVCKNYHNLFGLYDSKNKDYYHFARWEDSVIGYQKFIQYRYKGGNYLQFLRRIGYAEDPGYTQKVAKIATQLYRRMFNGQQ